MAELATESGGGGGGGGELSEGELEEGEVLSSEGEDEGEIEKEEENGQESRGDDDGKSEEGSPPVIGTKRSAGDATNDAPDTKAAKLDLPSSDRASGGGDGGTGPAVSSDAEEGEIFSDDEEAAYFPQRIKSRSTTGAIPSDASGSDAAEDKKTRSSRGRGTSDSPERDSSKQQRSSRRHRSRERGRDGEPKSLATLFFEDRDGTTSEQSDDGREGKGRRKGEGFRHSSSPGYSSSRSSRDRDRGGSDYSRDRDRRGGEGRSHYRTKDSHNRHGGSSSGRDKDWDHDSNVDSSDEEMASSSWSQQQRGAPRSSGGSGNKGYSYHHAGRGRRGQTGSSYQSKFGQKHGSDSRGRSGGRDSSNWSHGGSGRMTAQELRAQAEKVKKRREKGLSLLQTPKMKPSDNLDEFNYPAPPSWYLEAVEKWEKEREEKEKAVAGGLEAGGESLPIQQPHTSVSAGAVVTSVMPQPHPLFPPATQFVQQQQPAIDVTSTSLLGEPPQMLQPLMPGVQVPPAGLPPPAPPQIPSLFPLRPPPPPSLAAPLQPPLQQQHLLQPSLVLPPPAPLVQPPPPNPALGSAPVAVNVAVQPQLAAPGTSQMVAVGSGQQFGQGFPLGVAVPGKEEEEERGGGKAVVSTVRVSSLALDITNKLGEGVQGTEEDEEEEEEGRMKIALETPTPQPAAAEAKTFSFIPAESTGEPETDRTPMATDKDAPIEAKEDPSKPENDDKPVETTSTSEEKEEAKKEDEERMEVDVPSSQELLPSCPTGSQPVATAVSNGDPTKPSLSSEPSPLPTTSTTPCDSVSTTSPANPATTSCSAAETDIKTYSPPPQALLQSQTSSIPPPTSSFPAAPPPSSSTITSSTAPSSSPPPAGRGGYSVSIHGRRGVDHEGGEDEQQPPEESEVEEEDSDYDKYLDQLDEEEDGEAVSSSALVGAISASLLQNNPLDEDFPAINPDAAGAGRSGEETLKSLLVGSSVLHRDHYDRGSSRTRGSKSERRKQKESEWWSKQKNNKRVAQAKPPAMKPPCKFYLNGFCKQGEECPFSHEGPQRPKKKERCKFYLQDSCTKGDDCRYYHGEFPCKFFHGGSGCKNGDNCKFSHAPLTEETAELLAQVITPTKWADSAPILGFPHSNPGNPQEAMKMLHGPDSQMNIPYFSTAPGVGGGGGGGDMMRKPSDSDITSPLLISIPKQVLETSLLVSIPRQKLGPPFGTVPIPTPHSAPTNQPQIPPHSLPAPQPILPLPPSVPQSSNFRPPTVPPTGNLSLPPPQSGPPGNFPVPPPRPSQLPGGLPPHPSGWQPPPSQPVPLFPGPQGGPPNIPPVPLGQPPPPHMTPQFPPPPSSERKCLLPTPPSHMRLDPKNILWSEDERPEYWEAPGTAPFGHQPPPGGSFAPPPPHVPQPQQPSSSAAPRNQSVPADRMDPRQNRMELRPGGSIDPRRGGPPQPAGMGDPRHHLGGAPIGTVPPSVPPYQPPHPGPTPPQPTPPGYVGPHPPGQQWVRPPHPHQPLPPPQPNLHPQHQFPVSAPHSGPAQPPPVAANPGHHHPPHGVPGAPFGNPIPYQQPHTHPSSSSSSSSSGVLPPPNWGSASPDSSTAVLPPSGGSTAAGKGATRDGEHSRPLRVDPRTKYSHLKIKSKGSPSAGGVPSGGILKGKEGEGGESLAGGTADRTHMPKLLQEPPALQRPYDPHELFDTAASREVESDYTVSGPFGSSFGSFFTRSSPPQATGSDSSKGTGSLPYGEITMCGVNDKESGDNNSTSGSHVKNSVEAKSSESRQDTGGEGDVKSNSTKSTAVPSYLAELGVDSDLTIDSAFSSLKGQDTAATSGSGEGGQKTEVMAKKLPSIFGFGSGTL